MSPSSQLPSLPQWSLLSSQGNRVSCGDELSMSSLSLLSHLTFLSNELGMSYSKQEWGTSFSVKGHLDMSSTLFRIYNYQLEN